MPRILLYLLLIVAVVALALLSQCFPLKFLPVYHLAAPTISLATLPQFGPGTTIVDAPDRFVLRKDVFRGVIYKASGGMWAEDTTAHWNVDLNPALRPPAALRVVADSLFLPGGGASDSSLAVFRDTTFSVFAFNGFGSSGVRTLERITGHSTSHLLDRQVNFAARVRAGQGSPPRYAVTGGGGKFKMSFGDAGRLIAYSGVWRKIDGIATRAWIIPRWQANRKFRRLMRHQNLLSFDATLEYYSAPAPEAQNYLYPVYVFRGTEIVDGEPAPMPQIILAAAHLSIPGITPSPPPDPPRSESDQPVEGWDDPEPEGQTSDSHPEVGASWQGVETGGLLESGENVAGLLAKLTAKGWTNNFGEDNWGETNAWASDWKTDRATWADAADLMYFKGHAYSKSWNLWTKMGSVPDGVAVKDLDTTGDKHGMWGEHDLEWIAIDGCGPLQDTAIGDESEDALENWRGAFGGLHMLLGFATTSLSESYQGGYFAQYALDGETVLHAWFRAALEAQVPVVGGGDPSDIVAAAMYAYYKGNSTETTKNDHLWGCGFVAKDPADPDYYELTWTSL